METIDYTTRKDLVAALVDAHKRGIEVEVVGNGRTLQFPNGIGATPEDEDDTLLGVVEPEPAVEDEDEEPAVEDEEPAVEDEEPAVEDEDEDDLIGDPAPRPRRKRNK